MAERDSELVERILEVSETLVAKLEQEEERLDEYEKAQVIQALVLARKKLTVLIAKSDEVRELVGERVVEVDKKIERLVRGLDLAEVGEILEDFEKRLKQTIRKVRE